MFDLEKAIAAWRRSFKQQRTFIADDLDELEQHLRDHIEDAMASGNSEKEAFYLAAYHLGEHNHIETAYHQAYWIKNRARRTFRQALVKEFTMFGEYIRQDLSYTVRILFKKPLFTIMVILALALGIGANTAIFSVVNGVLLQPLPYAESDQIMRIWGANPSRGWDQFSVAPGNYVEWEAQNTTFEHLAVFNFVNPTLTGGEEPQRLNGARVTANFFSVLQVTPIQGRLFLPEEDQPGKERVAMIGHGLWQRRFSSDPDLIGQSIIIDGSSYTVIGIMAAGFKYPNDAEIWSPLALTTTQHDQRGGHYLQGIGRLKTGVTPDQAARDLQFIAKRLEGEYPDTNTGWTIYMDSLTDTLVGNIRPALLMLLGAVGCVLLIACANVANLLLARASTRRKEMAIRTAVGAQRGRIIRQLLTEHVILALLGGGIGLLLAYWGINMLRSLSPGNIPRMDDIQLDGWVLLFTAGLSILTGVLVGLIPALHISDPNQTDALKEGGRSAGTEGRSRFRSTLIGVEVALSLMILIGAGLLLKSFDRLQGIEPGFDPSQVLTARVILPQSQYGEADQQTAFIQNMLEEIKTLPGVNAVGIGSPLPFTWDTVYGILTEKDVGQPPGQIPSANHYSVNANYFQAMGIPLMKGRVFTAQDVQDAPRVAVINETMAQRFFPNEEPIGKRIHITNGPLAWREVVGIVRDVKHYGLNTQTPAQVYEPIFQSPSRFMVLAVRTDGDPAAIAGSVRHTMRRIDKDLPITTNTMVQILSDSIAQQRFSMLLLCLFAGIALLMAALGIYSVIAYAVQQRTQEIGVRMALGASTSSVLGMVVRQGMLPVVIGLSLGLIGAFALTRTMKSLLYDVSAADPSTYILVTIFLTLIALLACYFPARRAMHIDPMIALRSD